MDTPPYSDVSAQFSPNTQALHVNADAYSAHQSHTMNGAATATGSSSGSGSASSSMDVRTLYTASWNALESPPPPTLREILSAYKQKGDGDRDMLLAMLNAKSAEDQRIASQLSLRRTMLELNQANEPRSSPNMHHTLPHAVNHGHLYTFAPEEAYTHLHHGHGTPSPPAAPYTYSSHAQLRVLESPPSTQRHTLPSMRTRPSRTSPVRSHHTRLDSHAHSHSHTEAQLQNYSRRKRIRHSRSRSPVLVTAHRSYASVHTRSPDHSRTHSDVDLERSPYASASGRDRSLSVESGSGSAHGNGRTMTIGALLSSGSASNGGGRVKEERIETEKEEGYVGEQHRSREK